MIKKDYGHHHHHHRHHPLEELVGDTLIRAVGPPPAPTEYSFQHHAPSTTTKQALEHKDLVLLYFSGGWCSSCEHFTSLLKDFYKQANKKSEVEVVDMEVIYVSSDRDQMEFEEIFVKMPWLAVECFDNPHYKTVLTTKLHANSIPTLVVLDAKTGHFITNEACQAVTSALMDKDHNSGKKAHERVVELLQKWKASKAIPIEEAMVNEGGMLSSMLTQGASILTQGASILPGFG